MPIHLEHREAQPYAAVPLKAPIPFGKTLGPAWGEVRAWIFRQGLQPAGAPLIRYLTSDMSTRLVKD